ncbi:RluA family pseudouridine synthase [Desulfosporosinus sp. BG]|uniref:RluA family pseudouridine synthase n=1 Tax=Desulfosporosinus sp. BG TaxID=1633135 RepID=UPI00083AE68B|nr:RluA family pseudouridine synthase [Desulfosporosinus sp. BG]ODA42793.1 Ribosomal large subunit pseudouridine synthase C [Desulfosporosinus sp. BG]
MKTYDNYTVAAEHEGLTVETYLKQIVQCPGRRIQKLTRANGILLKGRKVFLQKKVKAGDILQVLVLTDQAYGVRPEEGEINVLYEDAQIIVLDKAAGQLVHPAGQTDGGTLANFLAHYFQTKRVLITIRPLHRLDRDTSGCVAFAKDAHTQTEMERQLQSGAFKRTYLAIVQGILKQKGVIDAPIGHCPNKPNRRMTRPDGDQAITYYRTIQTLSDASLLELSLTTGRTHQIRVHLAHIGHAILGDGMYGRRSSIIGRQALHASMLCFRHPRTAQVVTVNAPFPADMGRVIDSLK